MTTGMNALIAPALFIALGNAPAPVAAQVPDATQIVGRAVERYQRQAPEEARFEAIIEETTHHLDGDGEVRKVERMTYRQYGVEGVPYEELLAREGVPLDSDEVEDEIERRDEFAEEVRKRRERPEEDYPEDENTVVFNQEFVDRYEFSLVGEDVVAGEPVWVLYFEPREGDLPVRRRIDHALNKSTGRIWVSRQDFGLARVEFEMQESVRFWGGILGTLRSTVGQIDFDRVEEGVWLPSTLDIRFDLRILFSNIRRRIIREWSDYLTDRP
jgi:hypothetical protein